MILVSGAFAALAGRALWVQVLNQDFILNEGQKRYQRTQELAATRGRIVDRHGAMLAVSLATYEIWATPKLFDANRAHDVARLLDMPPKELLRRVNASRSLCCSRAPGRCR